MPNNDLNHSDMITKSATLLEVLTKEKWDYLISLFPSRDGYAEFHERLAATFTGSLTGNPDRQKECEAARKAFDQVFGMVVGMAKVVAVKDPSFLEIVGAAHPSTPALPPDLTSPKDLDLFFDPKTGQLSVSVTKVASAKGYQVWGCDGDPKIAGDWKLMASSNTCRRIKVPGLDRSKTNYLKVRAIRGSNEFGPWSKLLQIDP